MGELKLKVILLCLLQITTTPFITAQEARYLSDESTRLQNVVTIDLTQCVCSPASNCDLTIIRSSLMEVNCGDDENLCCPMTRVTDYEAMNITTEETEPASKPSPVTNVRIYSINNLGSDGLASRNSFEENGKVKSKVKKSCRCKARSSCPHKYIDYGFGFYCTYNTVRCCVPEEDITPDDEPLAPVTNETVEIKSEPVSLDDTMQDIANNETGLEVSPMGDVTYQRNDDPSIESDIEEGAGEAEIISVETDMQMPSNPQNAEGELLITEVTNWKETDYMKEAECFCLPIHKCRVSGRYSQNTIERRRDTLCPGDLIQCCGFDVVEEITKKKDDSGAEYGAIPTSQDLPPFQQPVQLPEPEIREANEPGEGASIQYNEEAISPPSLPTQYQNYDPTSYHKGYNYPANTYPSMVSGPQNYQSGMYETREQNIGPWVSLSSPSSYSKYAPMIRNQPQGYPRGYYQENGQMKPVKTGGLLDTFKQLLG